MTNNPFIQGVSKSGIGSEIAITYAKRGATLVLVDSQVNDLTMVAEMCLSVGANDSSIVTKNFDVSRRDNCALLIQSTLERFGKIDLLVPVKYFIFVYKHPLPRFSIPVLDKITIANKPYQRSFSLPFHIFPVIIKILMSCACSCYTV